MKAMTPIQRQFCLRRFGIAHAFLVGARNLMDSVLRTIEGARAIRLDDSGRPLPPDHVIKRISELPKEGVAKVVASSCVATTNLSCALEHSLALLVLLSSTDYSDLGPPPNGILALFDRLPPAVRDELERLRASTGYHDFDFEEVFDNAPEKLETAENSSLRALLNYWSMHEMLQNSHYKYSSSRPNAMRVRILIPYMAVRFVDRVLAESVAPRLELQYSGMFREDGGQAGPKVEWSDGSMIVSLPDEVWGGRIEARWEPAITTVLRVRKKGMEDWGVGFETPLNSCSFVDLEPGAEYEIKVAHKNAAGEGRAVVRSLVAGDAES